jgi:hypothetical protein
LVAISVLQPQIPQNIMVPRLFNLGWSEVPPSLAKNYRISIPTPPGGVIEFTMRWLKSTDWLAAFRRRRSVHFRSDERNPFGHKSCGEQGGWLLPPEARWWPFTVRDGGAYGPSVTDMKGGPVMNVFVLVAFAKFGGHSAPLTEYRRRVQITTRRQGDVY